jgi:hypothetical protein
MTSPNTARPITTPTNHQLSPIPSGPRTSSANTTVNPAMNQFPGNVITFASSAQKLSTTNRTAQQ